MKDKDGTKLKIGTLVRSQLFPDAQELQCVEITDDRVHIRHTDVGSLSIILTQKQMDESEWKVSGFSRL